MLNGSHSYRSTLFPQRHKVSTHDKVVDVSSRKVILLTLRVQVVEFGFFADMYVDVMDFGSIWANVESGQSGQFVVHNGLLFPGKQLCIPNCSFKAETSRGNSRKSFVRTCR